MVTHLSRKPFASGVVGGLLALASSLACGCTAPHTPEPASATATAQFLGEYLPTQPGTELKALFFEDASHVVVVWAAGSHCTPANTTGSACVIRATYAVNADRTALELTDEDSHETSTLPFVIDTTAAAAPVTPQGLSPLDDPPSLTSPSGSLIGGPNGSTVQSARITGQPVRLVNVPAEVEAKLQHCFDYDWSKMPMAADTRTNYDNSGVYTVLGAITKPAGALINAVGNLVFSGSQGAKTLAAVEQGIKQTVANNPTMTDYQRAALVTCVSSNIIKYADNGIATMTGATGACDQGEGVCREYASIAQRLYGAAGVQGGVEVGHVQFGTEGGGHAWNWVYLPSQNAWFQMEPQDDGSSPGVQFFNRKAAPSPCELAGGFCAQDAAGCGAAFGGGITSTASCAGATAGGSQCCMLATPVFS